MMSGHPEIRHPERITVVGLPGAGKTQWLKAYIKSWQSQVMGGVLVVDLMNEYSGAGITVYRPANRVAPLPEIEAMIKRLLIEPFQQGAKKRYRLVIFDEASRYFFSKVPLPEGIGYLNDFARHMDLTMVNASRRFSQVHTDLSELSSRVILFKQSGVNDLKRMEEFKTGMSDVMETEIRKAKHNYIEYYDGEYTVMPAI